MGGSSSPKRQLVVGLTIVDVTTYRSTGILGYVVLPIVKHLNNENI